MIEYAPQFAGDGLLNIPGILKKDSRVLVPTNSGLSWVTLVNESRATLLRRDRRGTAVFELGENAVVYRIGFWTIHRGDPVVTFRKNFKPSKE